MHEFSQDWRVVYPREKGKSFDSQDLKKQLICHINDPVRL